jgi:hypothetical protein
MVASGIRVPAASNIAATILILVTSSRDSAVHRSLGMTYPMALNDLRGDKTDVARQSVDGVRVDVERRRDGCEAGEGAGCRNDCRSWR